MNKFYKKFVEYLEHENKIDSLEFAIGLLKNKDVTIVELYEEILTPALNNIQCNLREKNLCIWKEHVRSAIVRTIIECSYPYVVEESLALAENLVKKKVIVLCPQGENHEIGARMVSDFFTLRGYQSTFVGANTPKEDFLSALEFIKPDYIVISITNYYNLVEGEKLINKIKEKGKKDLKIIVGGNAFLNNEEAIKKIGADRFVNSFKDISALEEGGLLWDYHLQ